MSGIVGAVDTTQKREIPSQTLKSMVRAIAHRGPAGEGCRQQAGVAMAVRKSHVADSSQPDPGDLGPFVSDDGRMWAVLDGRVFNHAGLRDELQKRGGRFAGTSDAELVTRLYQAEGLDCLQRLEGEFALVIWDGQRQRVVAVRDRLGVHHLFYTVQDGVFYFASEIKGILAGGVIERRLDVKALDQVLFMNCPVAPRTMFEGISALPAGQFLLVQDGQVTRRTYWDLVFAPEEPGTRSDEFYRERLLALLQDAVDVRMPRDRAVGVYLSGGLDSSAITALMRRSRDDRFPAYLSDFVVPAYSERKHADRVAEALDVPLNVVEMSFQRSAASFPHLIWHGEQPLVLAEAVSLLTLAQHAAQDVRVVLNGEGGDELLAGYVFNDWARIYGKLKRPPLSLTLPLIRAILPPLGFPKAFVMSDREQRPALESFGCFPAPLYYNYAVREVTTFYSDDMRAQVADYCPEADIAGTLNTEAMARWDWLSQSLYFSTKVNLPNYLLGPHGDRAASSAGLEAFFPFLDQRLMEFAARLPNNLKVRGREEKYLLKRAMEGILPDETVRRRKSPMTAPTSPAYVGANAPDYVKEMLSPATIQKKGYFDSQRVSRMVEQLRQRDLSRDRNNRMDVMLSFPLVTVLSVQIFDELFVENFYEEAPSWR